MMNTKWTRREEGGTEGGTEGGKEKRGDVSKRVGLQIRAKGEGEEIKHQTARRL